MVHKAAPREVERFRTPDRSRRRLVRVGPPANDNRRPRRGPPVLLLAAVMLGLAAALGTLYLFV